MNISKVAHPTPVPKSPVKKGVHSSEPHSNKTNSPSLVSSGSKVPPGLEMTRRTTSSCNAPAQRKKKKFLSGKKKRSRRHPASTWIPLLPSIKEMCRTLTQWVYCIGSTFSRIKTNSPSASWGFLILMAALITQSQAAPSPTHSPSSILSSLQPSPYRTVYPLLEMEMRTWAYQMEEVEEAAYSIIDDACFYLARADKQCKDHPSSCRTTMLSLENFKKAIST